MCPVCGWQGLRESPYQDGNPSYEICCCCGFEFGFDDLSEGHTFTSYRATWIERGMPWFDPSAKPSMWDAQAQIRNALDAS